MVERKVCFILDAGNRGWGRDPCPKADSLPDNQGARAFIDRGRGLHAEIIQSALTVIVKLVICGLTSVILISLGTVHLQFQVLFVSISLRPVLGTVAAHVMATAWSSWSSLLPPGEGFNVDKTAHRTWLRI